MVPRAGAGSLRRLDDDPRAAPAGALHREPAAGLPRQIGEEAEPKMSLFDLAVEAAPVVVHDEPCELAVHREVHVNARRAGMAALRDHRHSERGWLRRGHLLRLHRPRRSLGG